MEKRILFLFATVPNAPTGGHKVIYDYANRLVQDGFQVGIVYAAFFDSTDKTWGRMIKAVAKYIYAKVALRHGYTWYDKNKQIEESFVWNLDYDRLPKADVYVATAVCTASYLSKFPVEDYKKFYFIQGYESFIVPDDNYIKWTYRLPLRKIVISNWLAKLVAAEGVDCVVIPDGFNSDTYKITIPIEEKDKYLISMLYHVSPNKDSAMGVNAVALAKEKMPQLRLVMFGAYERPNDLPEWVSYYQQPSMEQHLDINNRAAIYIGTSKKEGWGLTVGEAMMCGQAVACTDIDGYREMASDGINALLSPVGDAETLAQNIIRLVRDDNLRYKIAYKGLESIKAFNFEKSYAMFRNFITSKK